MIIIIVLVIIIIMINSKIQEKIEPLLFNIFI
jgi:hypothetical protein